MKRNIIASTLGFALIASMAWIPSQRVGAQMFTPPPDSGSTRQGTGGASRGNFFTPKAGESAVKKGTGGASRSLFAPEPSQSAPTGARSGGSRNLFAPKSQESVPNGATTGGGSRNLFAPKSSRTAPNNTASGAFGQDQLDLNYPDSNIEQPAAILALLPQSYFGTTVNKNPEILVYLPNSDAREGVFSIKDAEGNTLHQMNVPVSGKAGVISIKVSTDLELEKNHQWFLALKIDGRLSTRTPYVEGSIKRIQPSREVAISIQKKDLLKQAAALGKEGIWYDCVATLAKLRATQPNNPSLNKHWSELLESVGLQQIDRAPVVAFNEF